MFYFVLELPATSDQLRNNSFNVYFMLWFPVVYLCNATIDFDKNFLKAAKCFAASRQLFQSNPLLHTPRSNVNSGACFDPLVNKGHEPGSVYARGSPGHAACTCCGEVWHIAPCWLAKDTMSLSLYFGLWVSSVIATGAAKQGLCQPCWPKAW